MEQLTLADVEHWDWMWSTLITPEQWTDQEVMSAIRDFIFGEPDCPLDEQSPTDRTCVVLLAAYHRGTDVARLAGLTGYPAAFVQQIADRMQKSRIWKGDRTDYAKWEMGWPALALDSLVADGTFVRLGKKRNGKYLYEPVGQGVEGGRGRGRGKAQQISL